MCSRYQPLADFLAAQPLETHTVTLTLPEIEGLLGQSLPTGASARAWWSNHPSTVQARTWVGVRWRVRLTHLRQSPRTVIFEHVQEDSPDLVGD